MKITNVSGDVNSQKSIRQQPISIGERVRGELNAAENVEASKDDEQSSAEQSDGTNEPATPKKKARKTKGA